MSKIDNINIELQQMQQQIQEYLQLHWRLFLAEGAFFIILGLCAIVVPQFFTAAIVVFLGWILLFGGIVHVSRAFVFQNMPDFAGWLFMGVLQVLVGLLFITKPVAGALTLTMLVTVFFALEGIAKISLALMMRPMANWGFVLFSGFTALIFALIVWFSWSESAQWLLGLFLGVNMVFLGGALVKLSLCHKGQYVFEWGAVIQQKYQRKLIAKVLSVGAIIAVLSYLFHPGVGQLSVMLNGGPVAEPLVRFAAVPTFLLVMIVTCVLMTLLFLGVGVFMFLCAMFVGLIGIFIMAPYFWPVLVIVVLMIALMTIGNGSKD